MIDLYYFAFGSNMLLDRIEGRLGDVEKIGNTELPDYKLVFNCGLSDRSYANIIPAFGKKVEGVLYKLTERQICILDGYEGWPHSYQKFYFFSSGKLCFGYWSTSPFHTSTAPPTRYYLNLLIDGAKENHLKYTYNLLCDYEASYIKRRIEREREIF